MIKGSQKSEAEKAIEKGLRRSSRLNPELKKAKDMVAMMTTIMDEQCEEQSVQGEILAFPSASNDGEELLDDPMAFKASTDPDIMYMHKAMREKDKQKFVEAMEKEVNDQMNNGNFTIVRKSEVPEGKAILPAV